MAVNFAQHWLLLEWLRGIQTLWKKLTSVCDLNSRAQTSSIRLPKCAYTCQALSSETEAVACWMTLFIMVTLPWISLAGPCPRMEGWAFRPLAICQTTGSIVDPKMAFDSPGMTFPIILQICVSRSLIMPQLRSKVRFSCYLSSLAS